jgi:hypothetical protein
MRSMNDATRTMTDFASAVHTALALHDLYGRYAAVALLDQTGEIIDMTPFSGDAACVLCALEWAAGVDELKVGADRAVVLSGTTEMVLDLREDDIRLFQLMRDELGRCDVEVVDWIQTDGDQIRSLTFSCDVEPAWDDEPG